MILHLSGKITPGLKSTKPDALSRKPDYDPTKEDQIRFGQLLRPKTFTPNTFSKISAIQWWFKDHTVHLENIIHLVKFDIPYINNHVNFEILEISTKEEPDIWADKVIIACIRTHTADNKGFSKTFLAIKYPGAMELTDTLKQYSVKDWTLYNKHQIEETDNDLIKEHVLKSGHKRKLSDIPGWENTLALVCHRFTWLLMPAYVNREVDG